MLSKTAQKAIEFYGGYNLWQNSKYLEAEVTVSGLAFTMKRRPFFDRAKIMMEIARPFSKLTPIGKNKNITGVLDGHNVHLEDENGKVVAERTNPRDLFPYGRRLFYWDDLDMAYFANYAFWNYFALPNLLMNDSIIWNEKAEGILEAIFPDTIPTHSRKQQFRFDTSSGKLIQHNYTADIISKLATAVNTVFEHSAENGLMFPSARQVTPNNFKGGALKRPILIDIKVHSYRLSNEKLNIEKLIQK